jgi:hypothetical protein
MIRSYFHVPHCRQHLYGKSTAAVLVRKFIIGPLISMADGTVTSTIQIK